MGYQTVDGAIEALMRRFDNPYTKTAITEVIAVFYCLAEAGGVGTSDDFVVIDPPPSRAGSLPQFDLRTSRERLVS
jgi:hypothetical protein